MPRWRGDGPRLAVGAPVTFQYGRGGTEYVSGQVWDAAPDGWWVRGDDGHTYRLSGGGGLWNATRTSSLGAAL